MKNPEDLSPENAGYLEDVYRRYLSDRSAVDPQWVELFSQLDGHAGRETGAILHVAPEYRAHGGSPVIGVFDLVHSYRELGHLIADLDPLGGSPREHPLLSLTEFGFTDADLDRVVQCGNFKGCNVATLRELVRSLRETYCGTIGVEYADIAEKEQRDWLQEHMERSANRPELSVEDRQAILAKLIAAEDFERFLHAKYPTQKRFSLEGGDSLIPLLDAMVESLGDSGAQEMVMGMAHRGRLNVLANILAKPLEMLLGEFEGASLPRDIMGDGDVKYHLGFSSDHTTRRGHRLHLSLSSNPSHLEMINPVIEGMVRAKQEIIGDDERRRVVPVLIHGDAAFSGEGIVPETLALSELPAYRTGGTIHVILNNQIGFTTSPGSYRFTPYASDTAKMIRVPVFHVNGDDPEAVVHAARLAVGFRQAFKKDVIIDLVCYRRHGHNELDDPTFTQPEMYKKVANHPTVRQQYEKRLVDSGEVPPELPERIAADLREVLDAALEYSRDFMPRQQVFALGGVWKGLTWAGEDWSADTAVPREVVERVRRVFTAVPEGFHIHPKLQRLMEARARMLEPGGAMDWGCAEALAFGTLLLEGTPVRLSGQDSGRGTFSHRHAVWRDIESGAAYVPLNHIAGDQAEVEIVDSPLSEGAVLGFEYGMSSADPHRLVTWEAQFGDFANVAQVFIDQFIVSAESKWQRMNGIVLLLPHGYEGQGPEHSSARLERFLQLCAENNVQVCNLTTPAQFFHALRRQMHRNFRKPLIVMTPKSLLRHRLATSAPEALTHGTFETVIDETEGLDRAKVRRLLLCSGKVYYTLLEARREREIDEIALIRVEQLYPFPEREIVALLSQYAAVRDVRWVQEEPWNAGAWQFMSLRLRPLLPETHSLSYVGRDEAASPATGIAKVHQKEEAELVNRALARIATGGRAVTVKGELAEAAGGRRDR